MRFLLTTTLVTLSTMTIIGCSDSAPAASAEPAKPKQNYVLKEGDQYGYEQALSADDQKRGQVATKVQMYSYLGRRDSTLQVMQRADKKSRFVAECTLPCEFVKVYSFYGDQFVGKETLRLQPGALLGQVFDDAANGRLDQMFGEQRGQKVTFWVDGAEQRLRVAAADPAVAKQ